MSAEHSYFSGLNYGLANEDSWVEHALAPENCSGILCIAGSGSRVLPLLARNPEKLEVVDLSESQLWLTELRVQATRALDYEEFLFFLGYRGALFNGRLSSDHRYDLFRRIELSPLCREFFEKHREKWEKGGFIYLGKWERHFIKLGKILQRFLRLNLGPVFHAQSLEEQRTLVNKHWKPLLFRNFLRAALSDFVFKRFLYGEHYAGAKEARTQGEPTWKMVERSITRFLNETLLRKNYFLQMMFLGELRYEEGFPTEVHPEIFRRCKSAESQVLYSKSNFIEILEKRAFDFYSLSDTLSYVASQEASGLLARIPAGSKSGATLVIRSFMRQPEINLVPPWRRMKDLEKEAWVRDCTGVYQFLILQR